jgi:hypothetical protein
MSRSFSLGVIVYVLFTIVLGHGYLAKELPLAGVRLSVTLVRSNASPQQSLQLTPPPLPQAPLNISYQTLRVNATPPATLTNSYFDLSATGPGYTASVLQNATFKPYCTTGATDYTWDLNGTRAYVNNTCVPYYTEGEIVERGYHHIWLYTYFKQQTFSRNCTDARATPKYYEFDPPGYPYAPDSDKFFGMSPLLGPSGCCPAPDSPCRL